MVKPIANKCLELANQWHAGQLHYGDEPWINHSRRLAQRAILREESDFIVGACYIHDILRQNKQFYSDISEQIKAIDVRLFNVVDKLTFRDYETFPEYMRRIGFVEDAKKLLYFEYLDELYDEPDEERRNQMIEYLPRLVC